MSSYTTSMESSHFCLLQIFWPFLPCLNISSVLLFLPPPCHASLPPSICLLSRPPLLSINSPSSLRHPLGFCFPFHFATCHRPLPMMSCLLTPVMVGHCTLQILAAYKALMERLLSMLGAEDPTQKSKEIIELETRLANVSQLCSCARMLCVCACAITSPLLPDHCFGI